MFEPMSHSGMYNQKRSSKEVDASNKEADKEYKRNIKLLEKFSKLSYKKKTAVLFDALDEMSGYNGRTVEEVIILAMGGEILLTTYDDIIIMRD